MKTKTIKLKSIGNLTGRAADDRFIVDTITDSAQFLPEQTLTRSEVEELCRKPGWKVTIVGIKRD